MSASMSKLPALKLWRRAPLRAFDSSQRRAASSQPGLPQSPKQVSRHIGFYQVFTRPVAKVLLMAIFTYQFSYWLWVKLEKDEIKKERTAEIEGLEKQLSDYVAHKKSAS